MSQQTATSGKGSLRSRVQSTTSKNSKTATFPQQAPLDPLSPIQLLSQAKSNLLSASSAFNQVQELCTALTAELSTFLPTGEESQLKVAEEKDGEAAQNEVFEMVKQAVLTADTAIDKLCFKRKLAGVQAESKKGVTAALEQMADEIWRAVAESTEKPVTVQLSKSLAAFSRVELQLNALKRSLEEGVQRIDAAVPGIAEQVQLSLGTSIDFDGKEGRDELAGELTSEGQRMLNSFTRYSASKQFEKTSLPSLRQEMDGILTDMVSAVQSSRKNSEDAEGWRLKKEVAMIRQKIQSVCKAMEDQESRESSMIQVEKRMRRHKSAFSDELEAFTESERSSFRPQSLHSTFSLDTEEIKLELARHLKESEKNVITALTEQKQGITSVNQTQLAMQMKQDELTLEVADIKRKLYEVFPSRTMSVKGKQVDLTSGLTVLKTLASEIRAKTDIEFLDKFSKAYAAQLQSIESVLSCLRSEGTIFLTLDEVSSELQKLKSSNIGLQEANEEALIKMIRAQSEYEIEIEFQKQKVAGLEEALEAAGKNTGSLDELTVLRLKVEELASENARLKGDAFDVSSVEPPADLEVDYSKNDELAYLKLQLHEHKQRLARLLDERKYFESRALSKSVNPSETAGLAENQGRCDREAAEIKKITRQIQAAEGQEVGSSLATRELEMKPADEKVAKQVMLLLNLNEAFEICGMVTYEEEVWALVKVASGFVWINTGLDRYKLSNEEMILECTQACRLLEDAPRLPRSVVLALGQLLSATQPRHS